MVMILLAHDADTPAGKPFAPDTPLLVIPVAPVVLNTILPPEVAFSAVLIQSVRLAPLVLAVAVLLADTVIEKVLSLLPTLLLSRSVKVDVSAIVGVPEMVLVVPLDVRLNPVGKLPDGIVHVIEDE